MEEKPTEPCPEKLPLVKINGYTTSSLEDSKNQQSIILFTKKVDNKPRWIF